MERISEIIDIERSNEAIAKFMGGAWKPVNIGNVNVERFYMPDSHITEPVYSFTDSLPYHTDWNLLMPVAEKIRGLLIKDQKGEVILMSSLTIGIEGDNYRGTSEWRKWRAHLLGDITHCYKEGGFNKYKKITAPHITITDNGPAMAMFRLIIQFIDWYNENKTPPSPTTPTIANK